MSIEILKKQLQQASLEGLYLLMGEEQYLIDYYSEKIRACCTGTLPEMNFIEIDGKKPDFDYLADEVIVAYRHHVEHIGILHSLGNNKRSRDL